MYNLSASLYFVMPIHKDAVENVLFGNWSIRQVAVQFAVSKFTVLD